MAPDRIADRRHPRSEELDAVMWGAGRRVYNGSTSPEPPGAGGGRAGREARWVFTMMS